MASHLTIIGGTGGSVSTRSFGGQQAVPQQGPENGTTFGTLLNDETGAPESGSARTGGLESSLARLFRLGLDTLAEGDGNEDADAIAALMDLQPAATTVEPKSMVDVIDALTALRSSLESGNPLDPELVDNIDSALRRLADALGLDIEALSVPKDLAALIASTEPGEGGLAGSLVDALSDLARAMSAAQSADSAGAIADEAKANSHLQALSDKLSALLAAMQRGEIASDKLAAIGMPNDGGMADEIVAALARFTAAMPADADTIPTEPQLASPALKTSEAVFNGKPAESVSTAQADQNAGTRSGSDEPERRSSQSGIEPPRREASTAPSPASMDASGTPTPSAQASQDTGMRVDASASPRVIQAGYQTSQQQLNLPQIAFELARQVDHGNTRFQIRLDPPELGRIDVRLDIDQSGQVRARLTVEKAETLDLMQRDQRGLERALQQAGLDSSKTSLEFSLKQNPFAGQQGQFGQEQHRFEGSAAETGTAPASDADEPAPTVNLYRGALQASGINIIA